MCFNLALILDWWITLDIPVTNRYLIFQAIKCDTGDILSHLWNLVTPFYVHLPIDSSLLLFPCPVKMKTKNKKPQDNWTVYKIAEKFLLDKERHLRTHFLRANKNISSMLALESQFIEKYHIHSLKMQLKGRKRPCFAAALLSTYTLQTILLL